MRENSLVLPHISVTSVALAAGFTPAATLFEITAKRHLE
jgi:hypothetical protein